MKKSRVGLAALAAAGMAFAGAPVAAQEVKVGALFGVTGPIASFLPAIIDAAQLAVDEINAGGGVLDSRDLAMVIGDTQGVAQGSVDAATKLVNIDNVAAVVGALTSGAAIAAANAVTIPNGVLQISPTATSPEYSNLDDNDYAFRIVPSDDFQGLVLAKLLLEQGYERVALSFVNNDYGVGIAGSFRDAYVAAGGTITSDQIHEPNKSSYRSELASLADGDPQGLVLIAFAGESGVTIVRQALENDFFSQFIGTDGMRDNILIEQIGEENLEGMFFTSPTSPPETTAGAKFEELYSAAYESTADKFFIAQTYDAMILAALAIEKAGSTDRTAVRDALRDVANPPGEIIEPGDWVKAKQLIADGKNINYVGASGPHDFDDKGDVDGVIGHFVIKDGGYDEIGVIEP